MTKAEPKKLIWRYTSIPATLDVLCRKQIALLDPENWDDRNDRYYMNLYKDYKKIRGLYGLCASTVTETYHHWRVFTKSENGACIVFNKDRLETRLKTIPDIRFGNINYKTLNQMETHNTDNKVIPALLPFLKRKGFKDEAEYRIIAENNSEQSSTYPVNIDLGCIERITINPWLPKS